MTMRVISRVSKDQIWEKEIKLISQLCPHLLGKCFVWKRNLSILSVVGQSSYAFTFWLQSKRILPFITDLIDFLLLYVYVSHVCFFLSKWGWTIFFSERRWPKSWWHDFVKQWRHTENGERQSKADQSLSLVFRFVSVCHSVCYTVSLMNDFYFL